MSPQPQASAPVRVRRRRRRSGRRYLYFSILVCGLVLIAIPLAHDRYVQVQRNKVVDSGPARAFDLVLAEVGIREEGGKSVIAGVLKNQSKKPYKDIQMTFRVRATAGSILGAVSAELKQLAPGGQAAFQTQPVPEGTARFGQADITGTPQ